MSLIILLSLERVTFKSTYKLYCSLLSSELNFEYLVAANERLASSTLRFDKGDYVIRFFSFFFKTSNH